MHTATIEIGGKTYPICYSANVACAVEDRFGSADGMFEVMKSPKIKDKFHALAWLASQMMESAQRVAVHEGRAREAVPNEAEILDLIGLRDIKSMQTSIISAIIENSRREVEAEPQKNPEATPLTALE